LGAIATAAALVAAGLPAAQLQAAEPEPTSWLCEPAQTPNPCHSSLATTFQSPDGSSRTTDPPLASEPKVDCFYVYPTVSDRPATNADRSADPQIEAVARYQASRFSRRCDVWAPLYPQVTVPALLTGSDEELAEGLRRAYPAVEAAWLEYWRERNRGERPFILIGHSQGAGMLTELIRQLIDRRPAMRKRMLSAILPGVVPTVPAGRPVGGLFDHVPTCERRRQTGCVIAWASYGETPPDDTRYGVPSQRFAQAFGWEYADGDEAICTNPARLRGGWGRIRLLTRTDAFPGTVGLGLLYLYNGPPPMASTPWVEPPDRYRARCEHGNGAHFLRVDALGDSRELRASPDATWGLHIADVNLVLGNLDRIVRAQKRAARRSAR
jgi:hypothetical protein